MVRAEFLRSALWVLPVIATGVVVWADNNPATEAVPRVIGYQGNLDFNGAPLSGPLTLELALYPDATATTSIYRQCFVDTQLVAGRFNLVLGPSGFSAGDGAGCDDSATALATVIADANDLHVGITIVEPGGNRVPLTGRQRVMPVPYALWGTQATNFTVSNNLTVTGTTTVGTLQAGATSVSSLTSSGAVVAAAYSPAYRAWDNSAPGAGGAAIVNDNGTRNALMVVGNNSAGGSRKVSVFDDLSVNGNVAVTGSSSITGNETITGFANINGTGGNVPHACVTRVAPVYTKACSSGEFAIGGGGHCSTLWRLVESGPWMSGADRAPHEGEVADAWHAVCQVWGDAGLTVPPMPTSVICCKK